MPDERGWLGRAQWMPVLLPEPLPGTRLAVALLVLFDLVAFIAGWVVAHVTASIGWGFVAGVSVVLIGTPLLIVGLSRLQRRAIAARSIQSNDGAHDL